MSALQYSLGSSLQVIWSSLLRAFFGSILFVGMRVTVGMISIARSLTTQSNTIHMLKDRKQNKNKTASTLSSPERFPTPVPTFIGSESSPAPSNLSFDYFEQILQQIRHHCGPGPCIRVTASGDWKLGLKAS